MIIPARRHIDPMNITCSQNRARPQQAATVEYVYGILTRLISELERSLSSLQWKGLKGNKYSCCCCWWGNQGDGDADTGGGECYEIALLRDGEHSRNIRTCVDRRHSRRRLIYVSYTSSVEVVLLRRSPDLRGTFLLHYNGTIRYHSWTWTHYNRLVYTCSQLTLSHRSHVRI